MIPGDCSAGFSQTFMSRIIFGIANNLRVIIVITAIIIIIIIIIIINSKWLQNRSHMSYPELIRDTALMTDENMALHPAVQ